MENGNPMNKLHVIYEDNHMIVVEKMPNILSQKDITEDLDMVTLIKNYLKEKYQKSGNVYLGLLHRLDRPVGGIMVFAKTSKAASRLSESIKKHHFQKKYLAVVHGILEEDCGILVDYLKKRADGTTILSTKEEGKYAELSYKVLQRSKKWKQTLVEVLLKTGRHHQIRVQFASRGYPLCGDQRYGAQDKSQIALFAYSLELVHPVTKEKMEFKMFPKNKGYWTNFTR